MIVLMTRWLSLLAFVALGCVGCSKNEKASEACKGATADMKTCETCCETNGASGYSYMNSTCGCLGTK
jgi:hypothetical protein